MTCGPDDIACRLEEISSAIGEPTWTDVATVWVAAAAAVGTLSIAFFNALLIWRQHAAERRSRRALFGVALRLQAVNDLIRKSEGKEGFGKKGPKRARDTLKLAAASSERSAENLRLYVMTRVFVDGQSLAAHDENALTVLIDHVDKVIDAWVENPRRLNLFELKKEVDEEARRANASL